MKNGYRLKFFIGFLLFTLFWFAIFYPIVIPWFNQIQIYPLLATFIFEGLLYLTLLVLTNVLLGKDKSKHSFKVAFIFFAIYHIIDSVEPPFIVNPNGIVEVSSPSAVISWDYGIGYTIHQLTGWSWNFVYYFTNIFVIIGLLVMVILLVKSKSLKNITKRVFD